MTLKDKINEDLKTAMKAGDKTRTETLRMLRAAIIEMDKRGVGREMTEEEEMGVLLSEVKKRKESVEEFEKAGRSELVEEEKRKLHIINEYLPKQLLREEVETIIARIIGEAGATSTKDFGKVMPTAMKELKGKTDNKLIQEIVRAKLGG
jgi:uncharacterized protein YqeY